MMLTRMGYAIRDERYRYVEWMSEGRHVNPEAGFSRVDDIQLFDYDDDPLETVNVAGMTEYLEVETGLKQALHSWLKGL